MEENKISLVNNYSFKIEDLNETYLVTFNEFYPLFKIKETIDELIHEYLYAEEIEDMDEEMLDEINTTSISSYILDMLSERYEFNVHNIELISNNNVIHSNKFVGEGFKLVTNVYTTDKTNLGIYKIYFKEYYEIDILKNSINSIIKKFLLENNLDFDGEVIATREVFKQFKNYMINNISNNNYSISKIERIG